MKSFFGKRVLLLVTGASRGLGLEIVSQFVGKLASGSVVVLAARDAEKLKANCTKLKEAHPEVTFEAFVSDNCKGTYEDYAKLLEEKLKAEPEEVVVVHNAGSIGDLGKPLSQQNDAKELDNYFAANVRHPIVLTSAVVALVKVPVYIINISSLAAIKAFPSMGIYCTGKAGRKMYFDSLALEKPDLRILQYSPGPLETDMMQEIRNSPLEAVSGMAQSMKDEGRLLTVQQTVQRLCEIIETGNFTSGSHIDYYDRK